MLQNQNSWTLDGSGGKTYLGDGRREKTVMFNLKQKIWRIFQTLESLPSPRADVVYSRRRRQLADPFLSTEVSARPSVFFQAKTSFVIICGCVGESEWGQQTVLRRRRWQRLEALHRRSRLWLSPPRSASRLLSAPSLHLIRLPPPRSLSFFATFVIFLYSSSCAGWLPVLFFLASLQQETLITTCTSKIMHRNLSNQQIHLDRLHLFFRSSWVFILQCIKELMKNNRAKLEIEQKHSDICRNYRLCTRNRAGHVEDVIFTKCFQARRQKCHLSSIVFRILIL